MKKWSILLMSCVAALGLAACGKSEEKSSDGSFTYMMHSKFVDWLKDDYRYDEAKKQTGVDVKFVKGADDDADYYASVDQKLISKNFPDSGIVSISQSRVYGKQGAFLDLKPYIDKYGPNIKKYINENPDYKKLVTSDGDKIYGIISEAPSFADFIFYRKDHFEKAGITKVPTNVDEFTDALRKLKAYYGKDNPNYYPFSGREQFVRFQSEFDAQAKIENGKSTGIFDNAKNGTDIYTDGYKKMVEWYADLYKEGLIDPEWVDGSATEESWESKMLTGKTSVGYDHYTRPSWFMDNGGPSNDKDYQIAIMPYLKNINGQPSVHNTETKYNVLRAMVVNASSKDKAKDIIKYMDFYFSKKGQNLFNWGVEGKTYKVIDGKKEYTVSYEKEETTPAGEKHWSFLNDRLTFAKPVDNEAFHQWNGELVKEAAEKYFNNENLKTYMPLDYTPEQSKELADLQAKVTEAVNAGVTKFVKGQRPMSEWNQFLNEMEDMGYKKVVKIQQEAYDANK